MILFILYLNYKQLFLFAKQKQKKTTEKKNRRKRKMGEGERMSQKYRLHWVRHYACFQWGSRGILIFFKSRSKIAETLSIKYFVDGGVGHGLIVRLQNYYVAGGKNVMMAKKGGERNAKILLLTYDVFLKLALLRTLEKSKLFSECQKWEFDDFFQIFSQKKLSLKILTEINWQNMEKLRF